MIRKLTSLTEFDRKAGLTRCTNLEEPGPAPGSTASYPPDGAYHEDELVMRPHKQFSGRPSNGLSYHYYPAGAAENS